MKISKNKLNLALARKQWNQRDLRDNAVVSSQTTLNINKGKEVMPATAGRIAAALGVDVTEIIEQEESTMYQYFHKLRVRFAELEMKQGEVAKRANMAESTLTARMTGRLPWNGDEIARVAKVLDIPADQIGAFFFVDAPKEYRKKVG